MQARKDAFGRTVYGCFKGKSTSETIERDDGFIDIGKDGAKRYFAEFKDWLPMERSAIKLAHGKILDVGCGAGRVELYFQKRRYEILGIDNSPLAIKVCKLRGVKNVKIMSFAKIGNLKQHFDTVVLFGTNFGLLGNYKNSKILLRKLYKITTKSATIIAASRDPYDTKNKSDIAYNEANLRKGRMFGQLRIRVRYKSYLGEWFDYLFVSKAEMRSLLNGTGWEIKKFYGKAPRYIAIIEKT
ncbi:MAG: methyltransferase domain-containing protein [Candidatus Micrarchaeota archaeon]|nr:methyltransferase domain-containing protein [Candidatus Micrarchaeota archaeon]